MAALQRVADARSKEINARAELVEAIRAAQSQGVSLRAIARTLGWSHTHVSNLLRPRA